MSDLDRYDWNFIWSSFVKAPRIREWLFRKQPPRSDEVVQALSSDPILTGYIFGPCSNRGYLYSFPDIGDLRCVYCSDGNALLGYHFGFQGVHPVMPSLFQIIKDPLLGNPNVLVRRFATECIPSANVALSIEFSWFESGTLAVGTWVTPVDPDSSKPSGLHPCTDSLEMRVFSRSDAEQLSNIARIYSSTIDFGYFPRREHFAKLPQDFIDPPYDYYSMIVSEPRDPEYRATLVPNVLISTGQKFSVESEFSVRELKGQPPTNFVSGTPSNEHSSNVSCITDPRTIQLWKEYQDRIARSRRTGMFNSIFAQKQGGRFAKLVVLFEREARYNFLSTSGLNVRGRIQRLCSQLQLDSSSPLLHTSLSSAPGLGMNDCENEVDLTNNAFEFADLMAMRGGDVVNPSLSTRARNPNVFPPPSSSMFTAGREKGVQTQDHSTATPTGSSLSPDVSFFSEMDKPVPSNGSYPSRKRRRTSPSAVDSVKEYNTSLSNDPLGTLDQLAATVVIETVDSTRATAFETTPNRSFDIADILAHDTRPSPQPHNNGIGNAPVPVVDLNFSSQHKLRSAGATSVASIDARSIPTLKTGAQPEGKKPGLGSRSGGPTSTGKGSKTIWTCDRCGVQIRGKKGNLHRHIANKHDNVRAYVCKEPNCGRKFQTRLNLVRHERAVHQGRPFVCPDCPRAFKYEDDLTAHIKSAHTEVEVALACDICGSCFGRKSTLNRHKAKVHKLAQNPQKVVTGEA